MLTSFTDPRRRVWNVGDYAVCRVFDPPTRLLSCHVAAIREPVDPDGRRSFAVDVMLYLPASNRIVPQYVHDPASQLFPSFDTFNAEEADANRAVVGLQQCPLTAGDRVLRTIAAVRGWLIHENDFTLQNWQEYTAAKIDAVANHEQPASVSAAHAFDLAGQVLQGLFDDVKRERLRRYDAARGPLVESTTTTTTSTTTTSCNTPNPANATTPNPARTNNRRKGRK